MTLATSQLLLLAQDFTFQPLLGVTFAIFSGSSHELKKTPYEKGHLSPYLEGMLTVETWLQTGRGS